MRRTLLAVIAVAGLSGCDPKYGSLRVQAGAGEVDFAFVSEAGISVGEGRVVVVFAEPVSASASDEYNGLERFSLRVVDDSVASIHRGALRDSFVIVGRSPGLTRLEVEIRARVEDSIPLEVIEQEGGS